MFSVLFSQEIGKNEKGKFLWGKTILEWSAAKKKSVGVALCFHSKWFNWSGSNKKT